MTTITPRVLLLALAVALAAGIAPAFGQETGGSQDAADFASRVDLVRFGQIAVQNEGRVKSFDSHAAAMMHLVSGPRRIDGQPSGFTYLDLIFRSERYADKPIIYLKNKAMRGQIADRLAGTAWGQRPDFPAEAARIVETGLVSREQILEPAVSELLSTLSRDLIRTARYTQMIETALIVSEPMALLAGLRVVPPKEGDALAPWASMADLTAEMLGEGKGALNRLDPATVDHLRQAWLEVVVAWRQEDADAVNTATARLAALLGGINPEIYPERNRLAWESWYFHMKNLTWVWIIFALALVPMLLFVVFRWPGAYWVGAGMFLVAFGFQTFALILRWYVADRWPNSNMFEAVTTSAWFGTSAAIVLEGLVRRSPMRGLFALASATAAMVAFMCAHFQPMYLDPNIANRMPVLHDVWLYIHTNVIIFSYCLIFMAAISATLYLLYRLARAVTGGRGGAADFARVGGAASLIMTAPDGSSYLAPTRTSFGQVLDGTTMVLVELSFIMLWAGLVMGAIWADHSWGRPWGWDPKEVFALNTFIVFAILVHVRMKVADKGLWTAGVALLGAAVMIFNWIAINFVVTGLHSYA